jgi:NADH-quinone oxidoreductase subunit J
MTLLAAADNADLLSKALACPTAWGLAIGSLALWLLVPGGKWTTGWSRILGGLLSALAGVLFACDLPAFGPLGTQIVFWLLALVTLGSGVAMISSKSPVYSALWFALSLVGSAGLFLMQGAQFLGAATIVVYAGAIVVTFLFVIMLAQPEGHAAYDRISWGWLPRPAALLTAAVFLGLLAAGMSSMKEQAASVDAQPATALASAGGVLHPQHMANLGRQLFSQQLIAVEVAGTLLMAALVGAIAIAIHGKQLRISELRISEEADHE